MGYEPYYLSNKFGWQNPINHSPKDLVTLGNDVVLAMHMLDQVIDLLHQRNVSDMCIRQALVNWIEKGTLEDVELHDFDKKVVLDARAYRQEQQVR